MSIRAVLFDLDGTLLDRDTSLRLFVRDQYQRISQLQVVDVDIYVGATSNEVPGRVNYESLTWERWGDADAEPILPPAPLSAGFYKP